MVRNLPDNAGDIGDAGSIPGLGRSPGERNGNPLQCSCLEKFHGQRRLAGYTVHGVTKSQIQLCAYAMPCHGSTVVWQMEVWVIQTERPADVSDEYHKLLLHQGLQFGLLILFSLSRDYTWP